mmetsp:Transcript_28049/g.45053  ORF Transcript_28049/g.45053 Transcript_28049/m.45053 type:complete len:455 (-) Transcript_28049:3631-4995(-)
MTSAGSHPRAVLLVRVAHDALGHDREGRERPLPQLVNAGLELHELVLLRLRHVLEFARDPQVLHHLRRPDLVEPCALERHDLVPLLHQLMGLGRGVLQPVVLHRLLFDQPLDLQNALALLLDLLLERLLDVLNLLQQLRPLGLIVAFTPAFDELLHGLRDPQRVQVPVLHLQRPGGVVQHLRLPLHRPNPLLEVLDLLQDLDLLCAGGADVGVQLLNAAVVDEDGVGVVRDHRGLLHLNLPLLVALEEVQIVGVADHLLVEVVQLPEVHVHFGAQFLFLRLDLQVVLLHVRQLLGALLHLPLGLQAPLPPLQELLPDDVRQPVGLVQLHVRFGDLGLDLGLRPSERVDAGGLLLSLTLLLLLQLALALLLALLLQQLQQQLQVLLRLSKVGPEPLVGIALIGQVLLVSLGHGVQFPLEVQHMLLGLGTLGLDVVEHHRKLGHFDLHLLALHDVL